MKAVIQSLTLCYQRSSKILSNTLVLSLSFGSSQVSRELLQVTLAGRKWDVRQTNTRLSRLLAERRFNPSLQTHRAIQVGRLRQGGRGIHRSREMALRARSLVKLYGLLANSLFLRSRSEFPTTDVLESNMAQAAMIGFKTPTTASAIPTEL